MGGTWCHVGDERYPRSLTTQICSRPIGFGFAANGVTCHKIFVLCWGLQYCGEGRFVDCPAIQRLIAFTARSTLVDPGFDLVMQRDANR